MLKCTDVFKLLYKQVPEDDSCQAKHVALCVMILKCFVGRHIFVCFVCFWHHEVGWCSVRCIFTFMKSQWNLLIIDLSARDFHGGCWWSDYLLGPFTVFRLTPALSLVTLKMEAEGSCTGVRIRKTVTWAVRSFRYVQHEWVPVTTAWRVLGLRMEERPPIWRVAANILNKQSRTAEKRGLPAWGLGEVLTTPHCKNTYCYEIFIQKYLWMR